MCKCKPMINMAETMLKNAAHLLARGLGEMRRSGSLPSNQACAKKNFEFNRSPMTSKIFD